MSRAESLGLSPSRSVTTHPRDLAAAARREGPTASRASRTLSYIGRGATFPGMEIDKKPIDRSLADLYLAAQGGDQDALASLRAEAKGFRAAALYLWAHLEPAEAWQWCSTQAVPPHPFALMMGGCLLHWGTAGARNDVGALTHFWLAGKDSPSFAAELARESLFELLPFLRPMPQESDLTIPVDMRHRISKTVWMIRAEWRGEREE